MGLLQRAIETYDANTALIGVYRDGHEPLAPIGHILTSANIEITLNAQGEFLSARKVNNKEEPKILIPVTEESSGRTSGLAAHPLCDQLKYVANTNKEAHELYLTALRKWERSAYAHPFLTAISTPRFPRMLGTARFLRTLRNAVSLLWKKAEAMMKNR